MTVYKRGQIYWLQFAYRGRRYQESTGQLNREAALAVERKRKDEVRQRAHGVAIDAPTQTPTFMDWAEHYYLDAAKQLTRPDRVEDLIRVALQFWGRRPADARKVVAGAPYHDLRLGDVVRDPTWVTKWEAWLAEPKPQRRRPKDPPGFARPPIVWSAQTKNQYRSLLSRMFAVALENSFRLQTGLTMNPFAGIRRERGRRRTAILDKDDLRAVLQQASYHLRLAIALGVLTPKLRETDILKLDFRQHFTPALDWLTVREHKTESKTGAPQVAYVPQQLRTILEEARRRGGRSTRVITYQGRAIKSLAGAVRGAVERAAAQRPHLVYGRFEETGVTFHTLRHTASTLLATLKVPLALHRDMMGHKDLDSTLWYTHLRPMAEIEPAEQLSDALPISDLVLLARKRPPVAESVTSTRGRPTKSPAKRVKPTTARRRAQER